MIPGHVEWFADKLRGDKEGALEPILSQNRIDIKVVSEPAVIEGQAN